jgi:hypothetical protein
MRLFKRLKLKFKVKYLIIIYWQLFKMAQEIKNISRFYNKENSGDEIFFDVYELILSKLDDELLVKEP